MPRLSIPSRRRFGASTVRRCAIWSAAAIAASGGATSLQVSGRLSDVGRQRFVNAAAAATVEPQDKKEEPAPAIDWQTIFQVHYDNRVRAFREQNQAWQNVVLLGDSITEGFEVTKFLPGRRVLNRGIGGDVIGNALPDSDRRGVLRRLEESVLDCSATHVFLLIGVNDLNSGRTPEIMEPGYRELFERLRREAPRLTVYVQSVLPTRGEHASRNPQIVDVNERLQKLAAEFSFVYIDLHALMRDENGELKQEFTADGLHLVDAGYEIWAAEVCKRMEW
ncbi:MAG: hypothetical protein KDA61_18930 [Planctomycetales bacterium]|nr:hypothetical protein [Planctomycetales bacterium]